MSTFWSVFWCIVGVVAAPSIMLLLIVVIIPVALRPALWLLEWLDRRR